MAAQSLDALDRNIIRELKEDGRRSIRKIARNLDTPEATIRTRMRRLTDQGTLRIVAFADPHDTDNTQLALVSLKVAPGSHDEIVQALVALPKVSYVSSVLGESDIIFEVLCSDNEELWEIINTQIAPLPGVTAMSTAPIVRVHKLGYGNRG
ncbi:Lrp/AsnC family transcriptional regulator [Leucobacter sp. cx-42]|uniref:Lrp/AsnC family transcriptional regulator n=1 Tax=unclassified Leucobacter TaxID=2621730 RepID=UPI00165E79F0|nr:MULTISPECIES: Lrp/AsnC family transcriptional regulator [unclassified Leucobacter]MBC9953201.1 Lrp/AsnC family transcriptional regulator [Leucobacter sp. cx-42]